MMKRKTEEPASLIGCRDGAQRAAPLHIFRVESGVGVGSF
jgi:hypothetical protein